MILSKKSLLQQASKRSITSFSETKIINQNKKISFNKDKYDLFLSHSYLDKTLVLTLVSLFNEAGYSIYVDWIDDSQLNRNDVSNITANFIKDKN